MQAQPLPFDVAVGAPVDAARVGAGPRGERFRELSVARLCSELARAFTSIGPVVVRGEVANKKAYGSSSFLTLRDRGIELSVIVPANRAKFCRCANGDHVAIAGTIELTNRKAQLQLKAFEVSPIGEGAIATLIAQTRQRLVDAGVIGRRVRPLPLLPRRIGVVCGTDAAVRKDIESVVAHRFPGYPVVFQEVTVQGPGGVDGILWGLGALSADPLVDVIVLARGGGDTSQLLPFSDESVCRAIAASRVPVVSAIGHDGDRPLSDDAADLRCGTPSIAAATVVPSCDDLLRRLSLPLGVCERRVTGQHERSAQRLNTVRWRDALDRRVERESARLDRIDVSTSLDRRLQAARTDLGRIGWQGAIDGRCERGSASLEALRLRVEALSPVRVLERGYAVVRHADGTVLRSAADARPGDSVAVQLAEGSLVAVVAAALDRHADDNRGDDNRGDDNRGDDNRGDDNRGDDNRGDDNRGDDNRGDDNRGDDNRRTGDLRPDRPRGVRP